MAFCDSFQALAHRLQCHLLRRHRTQLKPLGRVQFACLLQSLPAAPLPGPPATGADRIAIVVHLHYADLWPALSARLQAQPFPFTLLVTVTGEAVKQAIAADVAQSFPDADIIVMENRGRDVLPFLRLLAEGKLASYDLVCKLHAKKSPHRRDGTRWRDVALDSLIGQTNGAALFAADPALGMLGPAKYAFQQGPHLGANGPWLRWLIARFGIGRAAADGEFFAGTMFWVRTDALASLAPLARDPDILSRFEAEKGQIDGTLAHAVERVLPMVVRQSGWRVAAQK